MSGSCRVIPAKLWSCTSQSVAIARPPPSYFFSSFPHLYSLGLTVHDVFTRGLKPCGFSVDSMIGDDSSVLGSYGAGLPCIGCCRCRSGACCCLAPCCCCCCLAPCCYCCGGVRVFCDSDYLPQVLTTAGAFASAFGKAKTCPPALRQSAIGMGSEIALGSLSSWKVHRHRPRTFSPPTPVDDCSGPDVSFSPRNNDQESVSDLSVKVSHQCHDDHSDEICDDGSYEQFFEPTPLHDIPQSCSIFCGKEFDVSRSPGHSYATMFQ